MATLNGEAAPPFPEIHRYTDYRAFLRDFFAYKKSLRRGFSHRRFTTQAGLRSPNYLQVVMQGKRNMSPDVATAVAKVTGLKDAERRYFVALVRRESAKSETARDDADRALLSAVKKILARTIDRTQSDILSVWYSLLIRELVFLVDFEPSGEYISRKLHGLVTQEQALETFRSLLRAGLVQQNDAGVFNVADPVLDTGDYLLRREQMDLHHRETLLTWANNLSRLNPQEQERGLINIPISSTRLPELRERLRRFQDELIGWVQDDPSPDRIVQVGIYLFPYDV